MDMCNYRHKVAHEFLLLLLTPAEACDGLYIQCRTKKSYSVILVFTWPVESISRGEQYFFKVLPITLGTLLVHKVYRE